MNDAHAGDKALDSVLKRLPGLYAAANRKCEKILRDYLTPQYKALRPRNNEKATDYRLRVLRAFSGRKWRAARKKIALAFTDADIKAAELINDAPERAFTDGFNEAAYALSLNGVGSWPITLAIAAALAADGAVMLNRRTLKKGQDAAYNEQRTQTSVNSAVIRGISVEKLHEQAAASIANTRMNETMAAARAIIYGASDAGAYYAGLEAQKMGIDVEKTWLGIMDMRIRPSHKHLHGQTIPLDDVFHGHRGDLRYPHDPLAPPAEVYRCRCRMAVHVKGESPGEYSRKILPTETSAYRVWREARIREAGGELELLKLHKRLGR